MTNTWSFAVRGGLTRRKSTLENREIYESDRAEDFLWTFSRRYFLLGACLLSPPHGGIMARGKWKNCAKGQQARLIRAWNSSGTLQTFFPISRFLFYSQRGQVTLFIKGTRASKVHFIVFAKFANANSKISSFDIIFVRNDRSITKSSQWKFYNRMIAFRVANPWKEKKGKRNNSVTCHISPSLSLSLSKWSKEGKILNNDER